MPRKSISVEQLMALHEVFLQFPPHSGERRQEVLMIAKQTGLSECSVRRQYRQWINLSAEGRRDRGTTRIASPEEVERWITMLAAVQLATLNKKGHACSTRRAIELLEHGIMFEDTSFQLPPGKLTVPTANRLLRSFRIRDGKRFRQLVPVHFRAERSNELWQMDMSPSDAKYFGARMRKDGKKPYIYALTDDHSGVVYAEYRETRDENVQAALEVIYAAMAEKKNPSFPFQGIPECFYFDPGRVGASALVRRVLKEKLLSNVRVHQSDKAVGKLKKAARAKGKIERQFLFLKEDFESLFHFHRPRDVQEANQWLGKYLLPFNARPHPEPGIEGSRIAVWARDLPEAGYRRVCDPDKFWSYVAEPEQRVVGPDARLIMGNKSVYVVNPDLAGERVEVWYAADNEGVFVKDSRGKVYGPYPVALRPIPAGTFRRHRKTPLDRIMERIVALSETISIPQEAIYADRRTQEQKDLVYQLRYVPFAGPEPFASPAFSSMRDFYQTFFEWFKQPFGTLPEAAQEELERAYETDRDPKNLWKQSQQILRKHKLVR